MQNDIIVYNKQLKLASYKWKLGGGSLVCRFEMKTELKAHWGNNRAGETNP